MPCNSHPGIKWSLELKFRKAQAERRDRGRSLPLCLHCFPYTTALLVLGTKSGNRKHSVVSSSLTAHECAHVRSLTQTTTHTAGLNETSTVQTNVRSAAHVSQYGHCIWWYSAGNYISEGKNSSIGICLQNQAPYLLWWYETHNLGWIKILITQPATDLFSPICMKCSDSQGDLVSLGFPSTSSNKIFLSSTRKLYFSINYI